MFVQQSPSILENYVSKSTNNFDNSLVFSMEGPAKFFPVVLGFFV